MLKWLVQKTTETPASLADVLTDDPLATINFDKQLEAGRGKRRAKKRSTEIYSVNRTNPLYEASKQERELHHHFEAEREGHRREEPASPGATTSSSSSGYGSHGKDGVSSPIGGKKSEVNVGPLLRMGHSNLRPQQELEAYRTAPADRNPEVILAAHSSGLLHPPAPVWPGAGSKVDSKPPLRGASKQTQRNKVAFSLLQRNPKFVSHIGMFGGKTAANVIDVATNEAFVNKICITDRHHPGENKNSGEKCFGTRYRAMTPIGETPGESLTSTSATVHNDSIVTDSLLQMTSLTSSVEHKASVTSTHATGSSSSMDPDSLSDIDLDDDDDDAGNGQENRGMVRKNEDMDKVIRELTQAVMKSRNVSTLTRAMMTSGKASGHVPGSIRTSFKRGAKGVRGSLKAVKRSLSRNGSVASGAEAMRDLWQKTGMKTNGRKLLVDSLSEEESEGSCSNRRYRRSRRYCKRHGRRISPTSTSTSSRSSNRTGYSSEGDEPQYNVPYKSQASSSSDVYDDVYKGNSSSDSGSEAPQKFGAWRSIHGLETVDLDAPLVSARKASEEKKAVKFRGDVIDNEALYRPKLIYDKIPLPQAIRRDVVIDVNRLQEARTRGDSDTFGSGGFGLSNAQHHWEKYYGASGKFAGDPNKDMDSRGSQAAKSITGPADYRSIFSSPYFDYRRTHSKSNSLYSGSTSSSSADILRAQLLKSQRDALTRSHRRYQRRNICLYWKSILTVMLLGVILIVIVTLTIMFTHGRNRNV